MDISFEKKIISIVSRSAKCSVFHNVALSFVLKIYVLTYL